MPDQPVPGPDDVADRATFAEVLTRQREQADLSVRDVARLTGLRASTLGGWFGGQHLPQRSQRPSFVDVLRVCGVVVDDADTLSGWVAALERARTAPTPRPDVAPYRGLLPYEPADSAWFFGRERVTDLLVERIAALVTSTPVPRVLAVVGASGSGKSSVLRAGVVPAVAERGVRGSTARWVVELLTPGDDPRLAFATRPTAGADAEVATLLVVDQFEEVFAATLDDGEREAFLEDLFAFASSTTRETAVVIGLRADFYGAAVAHPQLARVLQDDQVVIPPMGEQELRAAIVGPAARADVVVDPDLVERLLSEMGVTRAGGTHDDGALPLLSHTLRATWERSSARRLTMADYDATGGIAGSIEQTAEDAYGRLDAGGRDLARRLFTRLVRIDEVTGVTTRHALDRSGLPGTDPAATAAVLDAFVERRLLTADNETVDISHERLLTAWTRIAGWVDADRDTVRARQHLADTVQEWQAHDRDPAFLLTGTRLAAAAELSAADDDALSPPERDLLAASVAAVEADRRRERRRLRRTRQLLGLVAALAVAASVLGIVAVRAGRTADTARLRAESDGRASLSRQVAIESRQLRDRDPALAQQLAVTAWRTSPTTEARSALLDQSTAPVVRRVLGGDGPTPLALSADGRLVAVGRGDDGTVHLWSRGADGVPVALGVVPAENGAQVFALCWLGSVLAVGGDAGTVALYDVASGRPERIAVLDRPFDGSVQALALSPDGRFLGAAGSGAQPVRVWDVSEPRTPRFVAAPAGVTAEATEQAVAWSPDGRQLAAAGTGGHLFVWPTTGLATAAPRAVTSGSSTITTIAFGHDSRTMWTGSKAGVVDARDATTLAVQATHQLSTTAWVNVLTLSPDGTELAAGNSDGVLQRFGVDPWTPRRSMGNPGPVTGVTYSPDGRFLVNTSADGALHVVADTPQLAVDADQTVFSLGFDARGGTLAVATSGGGSGIRLWDTADLGRPGPFGPALGVDDLSGTSAVTEDGTLLAGGSLDGTVRLWSIRDRAEPVLLGRPFAGATALVEGLALSPDGRLLAIGSDDKTVRLWDVSDPSAPQPVATMTTGGQVLNVVFSPDGLSLAAASADRSAYVWTLGSDVAPTLRAKLGGFASYAYGVVFRPDGKVLAVTSADRTTRLFDLTQATPTSIARMTGPKGYNVTAAFSPDGRELAVASNDQSVWLYDVGVPTAPRTLGSLLAVGANVYAVAFTPDGRHLVAGGRATTLPVWQTDPDAAADAICAGAGDAITPEEWSEYVPGAPYAPPCG